MHNQIAEKFLNVEMILHKAGVGEKMTVADLGCGSNGHFVFPAARMVGRDGRVYAVDVLKKVLANISKKKNQENFQNVVPVWSDLEIYKATKIEASSLDVALIINTLYQSREQVAIVRETSRLLKKDGVLVIVEWKSISISFGPRPESKIKPDYIKKIASRFGLQFEEEFFVGKYHYGLIFHKA